MEKTQKETRAGQSCMGMLGGLGLVTHAIVPCGQSAKESFGSQKCLTKTGLDNGGGNDLQRIVLSSRYIHPHHQARNTTDNPPPVHKTPVMPRLRLMFTDSGVGDDGCEYQ